MDGRKLVQPEDRSHLQSGLRVLLELRIEDQIGWEDCGRNDGRDVGDENLVSDAICGVTNVTARSFIPGASPNGKAAKWISPGCILRFPVVDRVDVPADIAELRRPLSCNAALPRFAGFVFLGDKNDDPYPPRPQIRWHGCLQTVLAVDLCGYFKRLHNSTSDSFTAFSCRDHSMPPLKKPPVPAARGIVVSSALQCARERWPLALRS